MESVDCTLDDAEQPPVEARFEICRYSAAARSSFVVRRAFIRTYVKSKGCAAGGDSWQHDGKLMMVEFFLRADFSFTPVYLRMIEF